MSLTVTISAQELSATVNGMLSTEQWELLEQICYERFPSDHPDGAAIRSAIKNAITENDKKDNQ